MKNRRKIIIGIVALLAILAVGKLVTAWLAPASIRRSAEVSANEIALLDGDNISKYVVGGQRPAGAILKCWVESYQNGIRGKDIVSLESPLGTDDLVLYSYIRVTAENREWILRAGSEVSSGVYPLHYSEITSGAGNASGPFMLNDDQIAELSVEFFDDEPGEPVIGSRALSEQSMRMDYAYVLKVKMETP